MSVGTGWPPRVLHQGCDSAPGDDPGAEIGADHSPYFPSWPSIDASWPRSSPAERSAPSRAPAWRCSRTPTRGAGRGRRSSVNVVGAFLLGYFTTRLLERLPLSSYRRPLLGTGLCGGLTTFSTMQVETLRMLEHHHYGLAIGYTVASIAAGLVAVYLATALVRRVRVRA